MAARLAEIHLDASASHPDRVSLLEEYEKSWPEPTADMKNKLESLKTSSWTGIKKDVGIFSHSQWNSMMAKTLRIMKIPVGRVGKVRCSPFLLESD